MRSLLRGEEMCLAQLFLQSGTAYQCVAELGERGLVEFRDLNEGVSLFQRRFVGEIRRCEELERCLAYLQEELSHSRWKGRLEEGAELGALSPRDVLPLQEQSEQLQRELREVSRNYRSLRQRLADSRESLAVIQATRGMLAPGRMNSPLVGRRLGVSESSADPSASQSLEAKLSFLAGLVHPCKVAALERLLWRTCRGHIIINFEEIADVNEDPVTGEGVRQIAFLISYWGQQIGQKVRKICECFHCRLYQFPTSSQEYDEVVLDLQTRIEDFRTVLAQSESFLDQVLARVADVLLPWTVRVRKMKAIYTVLNQCSFDVTGKCLIAEVWCPREDLALLKRDLEEGSRKSGATVMSFYTLLPIGSEQPPTLNRTNRFTTAFQSIVDAYGVGSYQEINPAPYTIITFPFLFAVMFGDVGHGLVMFLFALWMIWNERSRSHSQGGNEIWQMLFNGRYLLLLMGLFSIYTGLIYNDCFSQSLAIFPSAWHVRPMVNETSELHGTPYLMLDPVIDHVFEGVYPFGIDPIWQLALNKLTFLNPFKMKMSVILGVIHMTFGVILGTFNYIHFRRFWALPLALLPELLFLLCLFGYLVALIVYKWVAFTPADSRRAPSILIHFIDMFLFTSSPSNPPLYSGQDKVQYALVALAILCIPLLLLGKPAYLYIASRRRRRQRSRLGRYSSLNEETEALINIANSDVENTDDGSEETINMGDVFIKQAIHTIEYCLSCISNTASYLRLWALSLAHAQLSEVLWSMVLRQGLHFPGYTYSIALFAAFGFFAMLTVAILLIMEGLSAFLHALRLHWVEFQSKFYSGSGILFVPFSFSDLGLETLGS